MATILELTVIVFLGLMLGSFATALIYRIPRGIGWATGQRSNCTSCQKTLGPADLVPVFSWLISRGKCRYCGAPVSIQYPLTEIGVLLACLLAYALNGFSPETFFIIATVPFLAALLVIDLQQMILPNRLVLIVGGIGAARLLWHSALAGWPAGFDHIFLPHLIGAFIFAALAWFLGWLMTILLKKDSLGFGDVKFFAAAGLWLGIGNLALFCILSGAFGVMLALLWRRIKGQSQFPFGPSLITSLYVLLVV